MAPIYPQCNHNRKNKSTTAKTVLKYMITGKDTIAMSNKGKNKGNSGERKIAEFLSKLYGQKFMRVPNSGAFLGGANAFRKAQLDEGQIATFKADLIPPSNMRKLVIESKFYVEFPFHNLTKDDPIPLLDKWIKQAIDSADDGDFWVVVFRINHKGSFAVFDSAHLPSFTIGNHVRYGSNVMTEFEKFFTDNKDPIFNMVQTAGV